MIEKLQQFLRTTGGRIAGALLFVLALAFLIYSYRGATEGSRFIANSHERAFICTETGKPFHYTIKIGDSLPVTSPHSGKATGYPAEPCFWTADGKIKEEPTLVLLNSWVNKRGQTFCPDCGRLVVLMNPTPVDGATPPPKESEMKMRRQNPELIEVDE